jgi:hypothetical protein
LKKKKKEKQIRRNTLRNKRNKHGQSVIEQELDHFCKNRISSATDFKAVVEQYARPIKEHLEPAKVLKMNPLNGSLPAAALVQPAQSSIEDYQTIIQNKLS